MNPMLIVYSNNFIPSQVMLEPTLFYLMDIYTRNANFYAFKSIMETTSLVVP